MFINERSSSNAPRQKLCLGLAMNDFTSISHQILLTIAFCTLPQLDC